MEYVLSVFGIPQSESNYLRGVWREVFGHVYDHFIPHSRNNYHPHILGHRALVLFSTLMVAMKIFVLAVVSFGPVLPVFSSAITPENIISLTNQSRAGFSLKALTENSVLDKAAQAKANDMLAKGYFSHTTPEGKTPWTFITAAGYNYLEAGENLAVNFHQAEDVETAWMNSPGHKANIVNKDFEEIGIGVASGDFQGHEATIVVQMFGVPVEQKVSITNQPTKVGAAPLAEQVIPAAINPNIAGTESKKPQSPLAPPQVTPPQASIPLISQVVPQPLALGEPELKPAGEELQVSVKTSPNAIRVLAVFGERAVMLSPMPENIWQGEMPLAALEKGSTQVMVKAFDLQGNFRQAQLAYFGGNTLTNYNILSAGEAPKASFFGRIFNPKVFEQKFYLLFIALILSSLILAVLINRHVQHLSLIANSSFVVILAVMLWMGG